MTKQEAIKTLNNRFSFSELLGAYNGGNFWELDVNRYGDRCTFRVYNSGEITER